jgi:CRP-like cAMP-binding protein
MLSTVEKVMALKRLSFFEDTPNEVLADVAVALSEQSVEAGETIIEKGETGSSVYIITGGEVRIHDGENTIARLTDNDVFGEMSILDPDPQSATATALQASQLLRLDQEPFKEVLTNHSEVAWRVIQILTQRLRQAQSQVKERRDPSDLLGTLRKKLSEN